MPSTGPGDKDFDAILAEELPAHSGPLKVEQLLSRLPRSMADTARDRLLDLSIPHQTIGRALARAAGVEQCSSHAVRNWRARHAAEITELQHARALELEAGDDDG